jgi:glyoxylase-like metal-dependent hydrolase (beta-lactamase superfamily II)
MLRKISLAIIPAIVLAATFNVYGQAPEGQGRGRGEGRGRGGEGRGGDARGGEGRGQGRGEGQGREGAGRGAAPAAAQAQMIKQVKPGLYMVTGAGGNSTVRVSDQGVILVDTKNLGDNFYNDLVAQIKTVTNQPVKYVVITHVHQDHSGNIGRFVKAGSTVITNQGLKQELETGGADGKGYTSAAGKPDPPNETYTGKSKKIAVGKAKAEIYHFAKAHTGGDSVVYFPDLKVISLGDEFVAQPPNADYPNGGSVLEWPKALADALKLDWDTAIPGHGNDPMTRADVMAFQKKMDLVAKKAIELKKKGVAKDQIRAQIQAEVPEMAPWMMTGLVNDMRLDAFYNELTAAAK